MKERMTKFGSWLWRRTAFWRTGAGLTILVVALVGLRWWWIQVSTSGVCGGERRRVWLAPNFYGPAQLNHDGSKFIYVATADDRGRALFLGDTAAGTKRQIMDDTQGVRAWNDDYDIQAGPWSPDDRCFVCLREQPADGLFCGHQWGKGRHRRQTVFGSGMADARRICLRGGWNEFVRGSKARGWTMGPQDFLKRGCSPDFTDGD